MSRLSRVHAVVSDTVGTEWAIGTGDDETQRKPLGCIVYERCDSARRPDASERGQRSFDAPGPIPGGIRPEFA